MDRYADYMPMCVVEQLVRGHPVSVDNEVYCDGCLAALHEGQPVTVLAHRLDDGDERLAIPSIWCGSCAPERLDRESSNQWLVDAELGLGQHQPVAWLMLVCPRVAGRRD